MDTQNVRGRTECAWTHRMCVDAQNMRGRTECAWMNKISVDKQNVRGCTPKIAWTPGPSTTESYRSFRSKIVVACLASDCGAAEPLITFFYLHGPEQN